MSSFFTSYQKAKIKNQSYSLKFKDMEKIQFETYQRIYQYAIAIVRYVKQLADVSDSKIICNQLLRSGTSVAANMIEARAASSKKDFINFFNHALKSANETKFWLAIIRDTENGQREAIKPLLQETTEIANILAASILTMKKKRQL